MDSGSSSSSRRRFVQTMGGAAIGLSAGAVVLTADPKPTSLAVPDSGQPETIRMLADLQRSLSKPMESRRWAMVIDTRRCIGCSACTVACIAENNLPPGVTYRTVPEVEDGTYPDIRRIFMPTNCMQCDKAPCIEAANAVIPGSMKKRADGIVTINYEKMKGRKVFQAAKTACPFGAALYYDDGRNHTDDTPAVQAYEKRGVREYDRVWTRKETAGVTRKCHFCAQRLDVGLLPACVTTCTGLAMLFGDAADEKSLVSEILTSGTGRRLSPENGAEPRVFYVDDWQPSEATAAAPLNRPRIDCTAACHTFGK